MIEEYSGQDMPHDERSLQALLITRMMIFTQALSRSKALSNPNQYQSDVKGGSVEAIALFCGLQLFAALVYLERAKAGDLPDVNRQILDEISSAFDDAPDSYPENEMPQNYIDALRELAEREAAIMRNHNSVLENITLV